HKHHEENYQSQFHPTSGGGAGMLLKLPASRLFSQRTMRQSRIFVFYGLKFHFLSWAFTFSFGKFSQAWQKSLREPGWDALWANPHRAGSVDDILARSFKDPATKNDSARSCEAGGLVSVAHRRSGISFGFTREKISV